MTAENHIYEARIVSKNILNERNLEYHIHHVLPTGCVVHVEKVKNNDR